MAINLSLQEVGLLYCTQTDDSSLHNLLVVAIYVKLYLTATTITPNSRWEYAFPLRMCKVSQSVCRSIKIWTTRSETAPSVYKVRYEIGLREWSDRSTSPWLKSLFCSNTQQQSKFRAVCTTNQSISRGGVLLYFFHQRNRVNCCSVLLFRSVTGYHVIERQAQSNVC